MAKRATPEQQPEQQPETSEIERAMAAMFNSVQNATTQRSELLRRIMGSNERDLDTQLKYPSQISVADYHRMYERSDIAERVVRLYADGCWAVSPVVYDVEDEGESSWEKAWRELEERLSLFHYLHRLDVLSGIGHYGVMLLGIADGRPLREPVLGFDLKEQTPNPRQLELEFVRPFSHRAVYVNRWDTNPQSPRFQLPETYNLKINMSDAGNELTEGNSSGETVEVHWSRIFHYCDGNEDSEVFAKPRQRPVYNRLLDVRKLLGGSAEMYWGGAFPGYAFEVDPEYAAAAGLFETEAGEAFREKVRGQFAEYSSKLQRYLAAVGVKVKSLAPQVADPAGHLDVQLRAIAITMDCPYRIFLGSEEGKLASSQDLRHWNRKLAARHRLQLTPKMIRPLVKRFIMLGVLPEPSEDGIKVFWPDLDTLTEQDKCDVADKRTTAIQKYVASNMETLIPPKEYFIMIMGMTAQEADKIVKAMEAYRPELMERKQEEMEMQVEMQSKMTEASGGADNQRPGKTGGANPRSPSKDRTRSGSGASGSN